MKKIFMSMMGLAVALGFGTSCSDEKIEPASVGDAQVTFTISMEGESGSRAYSDGTTAKQLIFAVYEANGKELTALRQGDRGEIKFDENLKATVTTQLVKGKSYDFVFWAQPDGGTAFDVSDMRHIKVNYNEATLKCNNELLDAFYYSENDVRVTGSVNMDVTLRRPFAQVNFGTSKADWNAAVNAGVGADVTTKLTFDGGIYSTLNTRDGSVSDEIDALEFDFTNIPVRENEWLPNVDALKKNDAGEMEAGTDGVYEEYRWLAMTYVLVNTREMSNKVTMALQSATVDTEVPVSNVPLQRNYRTNIVGDLLTTGAVFNVVIDPMYEKPDNNIVVWNGEDVEEPTETDENGNLLIKNAAQLAWVSAQVAAGNTFDKQTLVQGADIDLNNQEWTPIGTGVMAKSFYGNFDGNGYKIYNLNATAARNAALFGSIYYGVISNVTIENATVASNHYAAALVAWSTAADITGCTVRNATVTVTPELIGATYDNGDKAGVLAGYVSGERTADVSNNTVENSTVTAYRDLGAIMGTISGATVTATNNVATNVEVIADRSLEAKYVKAGDINAGEIVGRNIPGTDIYTCTANNVNITYKLSTVEALAKTVEAAPMETLTNIVLAAGDYTSERITVSGGKNVKITGEKGAAFDGQFFLNGTGTKLTLKGLTLTNANATTNANSQTKNNAISVWGETKLLVEDCTINLVKDSGILDWWGTGVGTDITVKRTVFNCNGYRPLQLHDAAVIDSCTFNEPYRYALQINSQSATTVQFTNNTINKTQDNGKPAYGIQLTSGGSEDNAWTGNKTFILGGNNFKVTVPQGYIPYVYEEGSTKLETCDVTGGVFVEISDNQTAFELSLTDDVDIENENFVPFVAEGSVGNQNLPMTIDGNGKTVTFSADDAASMAINQFTSSNGSKVTVNDITFAGEFTYLSLGHYATSTYANYDTEFNNVNVVGVATRSYSQIACPVLVYGKAVMNNCNIYGTVRSEKDQLNYPLYDFANVNYSDATLKGGKYGSVYTWTQCKLTVDGAEVDRICGLINGRTGKDYGLYVTGAAKINSIELTESTYQAIFIQVNIGAEAEVGTLSLTGENIDFSKVVIADGAKIGKVIVNEQEMTLEQFKAL